MTTTNNYAKTPRTNPEAETPVCTARNLEISGLLEKAGYRTQPHESNPSAYYIFSKIKLEETVGRIILGCVINLDHDELGKDSALLSMLKENKVRILG